MIINPLPYTITNGTLANADEVQADFDYIVSQVNANAQPGGGGAANTIAWTLMPTAPTFVSTTSFTMTGDQSASFTVGRRLKSTNTGGLVYSTVIAAVVVLNTTVTVTNQSGVLDSGMSDVSIGTLDPVNAAVPAITNLFGQQTTALLQATLCTMNMLPPVGDVLSEINVSLNTFTPKVSGTYVVDVSGYINSDGDSVSTDATVGGYLYLNGVALDTMGIVMWPFTAGVQTRLLLFSGSGTVAATAGDTIKVVFNGGTFTGGNMFINGHYTIRRLPYA